MANRTFDSVLNHFSFIHTPTFKLVDTSACLAFAICTIGGVRSNKHQYQDFRTGEYKVINPNVPTAHKPLDGPVPPTETWDSMYKRNYHRGGPDDEAVRHVEKWENGHIVRVEKTNMLVKVSRMSLPGAYCPVVLLGPRGVDDGIQCGFAAGSRLVSCAVLFERRGQ